MLLGNINNPCVNRWGINSFWSHYWYSDKRYNQFLQQDIMFTTLIKTYVYYGAEAPPRFLQDKMWYKRSNLLIENWLPYENRWYTKVEIDLGYTVAYILRRESPEIFETRWNILRFNKWVVFNVRWLQPNKTKKKNEIKPWRRVSRSMQRNQKQTLRKWVESFQDFLLPLNIQISKVRVIKKTTSSKHLTISES